MFTHNDQPTRRRFVGAASALAAAAVVGCESRAPQNNNQADDPGRRVPKPPAPSLQVLKAPWQSKGDVDWQVAALLGQMAKDVYLPPDDAVNAFKQLGFENVAPFVVASMVGAVAQVGATAVVAFRGTDELEDWLSNLDVRSMNIIGGKIHAGFYNAYKSLKADIRQALSASSPDGIWITGHSLGGALAVACGLDLVQEPVGPLQAVVTFGQPMIAKADLAETLADLLAEKHQRFVNGSDVVARIPPRYIHTGNRVWFDDDSVEIERQRMFGAPSDTAELEAGGPAALSMEEFRALQADLQQAENVDEVDAQQQRTFRGNLPWLRDHAMELYMERIHAQQAPAPSQEPA